MTTRWPHWLPHGWSAAFTSPQSRSTWDAISCSPSFSAAPLWLLSEGLLWPLFWLLLSSSLCATGCVTKEMQIRSVWHDSLCFVLFLFIIFADIETEVSKKSAFIPFFVPLLVSCHVRLWRWGIFGLWAVMDSYRAVGSPSPSPSKFYVRKRMTRSASEFPCLRQSQTSNGRQL